MPGGTGRDRTEGRARQAVARRALIVGFLLASCTAVALDPGQLVIETPAGGHPFTVELAVTPGERARGLMFRRRMRPDHGMLFDFQTEQPVAFWMRKTPLPLDILFIDAAGTVTQIAPDTVPFSEEAIPSDRPVRAVLEVNAGTAQRLGIAPGARVRHAIFGR